MLTALFLPEMGKWFISAAHIFKHISTLVKFMEPMRFASSQTGWQQLATVAGSATNLSLLSLSSPNAPSLSSAFSLASLCALTLVRRGSRLLAGLGHQDGSGLSAEASERLFHKSCPADEIVQNQSQNIKH